MDILCQAKSGMGKTAVFVLATLQQIEPVDGQVRNKIMHYFVFKGALPYIDRAFEMVPKMACNLSCARKGPRRP